VKEVKHYCNKK